MEKKPINELMNETFENIKSIFRSDLTIGKAIVSPDNSVIVPITKITMGFVAGGGEYGEDNKNENLPFAGGAGTGVSLTPIGFLICYAGKQNFIKLDKEISESKWMDLIQAALKIIKES